MNLPIQSWQNQLRNKLACKQQKHKTRALSCKPLAAALLELINQGRREPEEEPWTLQRWRPPAHPRPWLTSRPITAPLAKQTRNYWLFSRAFLLPLCALVLIRGFFLPFSCQEKKKESPSANTWYSSERCSCTVLLNCYHLFHKQFWQLTSWSYTSKETTVEFNLPELPRIPLWFFFKHFHPEQKRRLIRLLFIFPFCQFIKRTNILTSVRYVVLPWARAESGSGVRSRFWVESHIGYIWPLPAPLCKPLVYLSRRLKA